MNLIKKAAAGFSSITLRGGRITKWNGQAASYAPHVGASSISIGSSSSALAISIALAGAVAIMPGEARGQSVTHTADQCAFLGGVVATVNVAPFGTQQVSLDTAWRAGFSVNDGVTTCSIPVANTLSPPAALQLLQARTLNETMRRASISNPNSNVNVTFDYSMDPTKRFLDCAT